MTQALDLLNSLSDAEIAAITAQPDPEGHIIVGGDRRIIVPSNLKRLGVQFDHNMETVTFDCPRYWDDRDMSEMAVYINYMRSDGYADKYPADNVRADGEVMHFDWTISRNVTEVPGAIGFLVCVMKTDSEGNEERHWNSELCNECHISQGMECEEHPALQYPDEVTQLLLRMATVEQINVQAEEMQTLYDNTVAVAATAEETKNQALDASGYIKNSYAPAIKGNVSGEIIRVDDVSPIEHDVKCFVHGKNLFDGTLTNGIYLNENFSVDVGSYTAGVFNCIKLYLRAGTYTLSFSSPVNLVREVIDGEYRIVNGDGYTNITTYSFTPNTDGYYGLSFRDTTDSSTVWDTTNTIQIEQGSVATEYVEYIDASSVSVYRYGKNLIQYPYATGSTTFLGVTFVSKDDGSVFANGTSTDNTIYYLSQSGRTALYLHPGTYRLSGCPAGGTDTTYRISVKTEDPVPAYWHDYGSGCTFTLDAFKQVYVYVRIAQNSTVTNLKFKPQLELANETTGYELGSQAISIPASDGTCMVTSVNPTMTLFTDTPGVTIEAEYNRDTTKMFESYVLTDSAKSEIASIVESDMAEVLASLNEYAETLIGGGS